MESAHVHHCGCYDIVVAAQPGAQPGAQSGAQPGTQSEVQSSSEETKADDGANVQAMMNKPPENPLPKPVDSGNDTSQQSSSSQEETIKRLEQELVKEQRENQDLRNKQQPLVPAFAPYGFQPVYQQQQTPDMRSEGDEN